MANESNKIAKWINDHLCNTGWYNTFFIYFPASPVTYPPAPPYYYPTPPNIVPLGSYVPMALDNQHPSLIRSQIRYGPPYQYLTAQASPAHQTNRPYPPAAIVGVPPAMWNYKPGDFSHKDNIHKPKTEFKILDKPPVFKESEEVRMWRKHPDRRYFMPCNKRMGYPLRIRGCLAFWKVPKSV